MLTRIILMMLRTCNNNKKNDNNNHTNGGTSRNNNNNNNIYAYGHESEEPGLQLQPEDLPPSCVHLQSLHLLLSLATTTATHTRTVSGFGRQHRVFAQ